MRRFQEYTILNSITPVAIVSSTNASPINIEATAHGFSTGDRVVVIGHATNTAANGFWTVTRVDANNFTLDGSTGNGVGGATGICYTAPRIIDAGDFRHVMVEMASSGSANMTILCRASLEDDSPDFAAAQSTTEIWENFQMIDKQPGSAVDGDTGLVLTGTDDFRNFEVNTNGAKWVTWVVSAWSAGAILVKARLYNDQ